MDTPPFTLHPSHLFAYRKSAPGEKPGTMEYEDCILTRTIIRETQERTAGPHPMGASYHNDGACFLGTPYALIITKNERVMVGWRDNNDLSLDVPYRNALVYEG